MGIQMGSLSMKQMHLEKMNASVDQWSCPGSALLLNYSLNWHLLAEKIGTLKIVVEQPHKCEKSVLKSQICVNTIS